MSSNRSLDEYDYIICGGGTSGCVIAARLAEAFPESGPSILIVEAGPDSNGLQSVSMVGGLFQAMGGELDWDFETVPQKHMDDRVLKLARGKFLGGSSGFNGTLCVRGSKADYDEWDLEGWNGDEMFRCMKKAETFHGKTWFNAASEHGRDGPLHVEPHDAAPISNLLLEAMQEKGLPQIDDVFTTGESAHACGHVPRSVHNGSRTFAADYLRGYKHRIDIIVSTVVDKVIFEQQSDKLVATGIEAIDPSGSSHTIQARKEVIISSGAYCSPTILLRSGIGPRTELAEHGLPCRLDLPGVGKNFQDHLVTFVPYEVTAPNLTHDAHIHHPGGAEASMANYAANQSGVFASFPFGVFGFARLDDRLPASSSAQLPSLHPTQPHIELMHTELYSGHIHGQHALLATSHPRHAFEMMTLLFAQQSTGAVTLSSTSPHAAPRIDPAYLSHPADLPTLSAGVRFAHELVTQSAALAPILAPHFLPVLDAHFSDLWGHGAAPGSAAAKALWDDYVRTYTATAHHPAGTCRMGTPGGADATVVVDERLRVCGVAGLRVADCSVVPKLSGGHTQMVAYAIGEKAAELLVEEWRAKSG